MACSCCCYPPGFAEQLSSNRAAACSGHYTKRRPILLTWSPAALQLQEDAEHHAGSAASNFLRTIQQKHKTHPARMSVALLEKDAEVKAALDDEAVADSTPVLQVGYH